MSRYLNPKDQPKEVWLLDNGFIIPNPFPPFPFQLNEKDIKEIVNYANSIVSQMEAIGIENRYNYFDEWCIVDLVNNGKFRAAAVYTSRDEVITNVKAFLGDTRQHIWFMVKKDKALAEVRDFIPKS